MEIEDVLGVGGQADAGNRRFGRKTWIAIGLALAAFVVLAVLVLQGSGQESAYVTVPAKRGDLSVSVTSTGTTQPSNEVSVGIEVSGTVSQVMVDFNEEVRAGQVLARLDTALLAAQVAQSKASLDSAVAQSEEAKATYTLSERELARLMALREASGGALPAAQELDNAEAALERARASLGTAGALFKQAQAQLSATRTELSKATIVSPIDGIVLSRNVDPGQTVAASLQTPELFVLAENLSEMELSIDIDEADVGTVSVGQSATFTVDAYPNEVFVARIDRVYFAPKIEAGVVTYEAILSVDNSDLRLRPGMTVTAVITTQEISNALLVPNAAFRFAPEAAMAQEERGLVGSLLPLPPGGSMDVTNPEPGSNKRTLWVVDADDQLQPVEVTIGSSDGNLTVVLGGDIEAGSRIVTEQVAQ